MSLDAEEIVVGGNHRIYVAPAGTPLPAKMSDTLNGNFLDLGYTTEDGVKFVDAKTIQPVQPSQSFYPVRQIVQNRQATAEFSMLQWNRGTVALAFGGGTWSVPASGQYRYTPPDPETIDERAMVIRPVDGDRDFQFVIALGFVTNNVESTFARTGPGLLPITFSVLSDGSNDPWVFDTNDPAFADTGS